ncbi:MAG: recombination mediator RecR [Patescibacteria group bacterium]
MLPESITKVTEKLMQFPALGRRSSQKIALQILEQNETEFKQFVDDLEEMKRSVTFCPTCHFFSEKNLECNVCQDRTRKDWQLCVVEKATEAIVMEKSMVFRGRYHVLGKLISPLDNVFAQNTNIPSLMERLQKMVEVKKAAALDDSSKFQQIELILFLQPSFNAEATTAYIREKIKELDLENYVRLSKMAQGLPSFYNVDTLDQETLAKSIEGRVVLI